MFRRPFCKFVLGCASAFAFLAPLHGACAAGGEKLLYQFKGASDGGNPSGALILDSSGNLYGTAGLGGKKESKNCSGLNHGDRNGTCGVVFKIAAGGGETVLYPFTGGNDGSHPASGLTEDSSGNFYGTTGGGGGIKKNGQCGDGCGTVFKLASSGTESVLHAFTGGSDGQAAVGGVILDGAGNLYGTTVLGGNSDRCGLHDNGCGIVFKLASGSSTESILHVFTGGSDGAYPSGGLVEDGSGNLFGTTAAGGGSNSCGDIADGCGTVFEIASNGTESVLHVFTGGSDGAYPMSSLVEDGSGNLYGTTAFGGNSDNCGEGAYGCGTVFKIPAKGSEAQLHVFTGGADGGYPIGSILFDSSGNLYGTTTAGGSTKNCGEGPYGCGTVYKIAANGSETILHVFAGKKKDGAYPTGALVADKSGNLYGTALGGGKKNKACFFIAGGRCGAIFTLKE